MVVFIFFFNDTATTEIYTLSLHDALPIWILTARRQWLKFRIGGGRGVLDRDRFVVGDTAWEKVAPLLPGKPDRKSTRLNSSHANISYAVFCLKKKKTAITVVDNYSQTT